MKNFSSFIIILTLLFLISNFNIESVISTQGTSYYVANDGDDSNDGLSPSSPWKTVEKINNEMNSGIINQGDDIYFNRGDTWVYPVTLTLKKGGNANNEMIIGSYGIGDYPKLSGKGQQAIFCDSNISYITLQDLNLTNSTKRSIFFYNGCNAHNITLRNLEIYNPDNSGGDVVGFYNTKDVLIDNCSINVKSMEHHGISIQYYSGGLFQCGNFVIRNCIISNCKDGISIHFGDGGESQSLGDNFLIENCVISGTSEECIDVVGGHGCENVFIKNCEMYNCYNLVAGHGQANVVIDNVYIHDVSGNGFTLTTCYNVVMRNSVIYNWGASKNGISKNANQYSPDETNNVCFYNNDIISDGDSDHIQINNANVDGLIFKNNIFYSTVSTSPDLFLNYISPASLSNTNSEFSYNLWWRGDGGVGDDTWWKDAGGTYDFDGWLAKNEVSNEMRQDPEISDPESGDFNLGISSPCIDAGGWLTCCDGGGSGKTIAVDDASYFFAGLDSLGVSGDDIFVGDDTDLKIVAVDYDGDTITVDKSISWVDGDLVSLSSYYGYAPDIGAYESFYYDPEPESDSPEISNILLLESNPLDTDEEYGWINITSDVTSDTTIIDVRLVINYQDSTVNVSMNSEGSNSYYYKSSNIFTNHGYYDYYIWAIDINGNQSTSNIYDFAMPPNWDIDENGVCNLMDLQLISNHYNEIGENGWIREDVDNNGIIQVLDLIQISSYYGETW